MKHQLLPSGRKPATRMAGWIGAALLGLGLLPQQASAGNAIGLFKSITGKINCTTAGWRRSRARAVGWLLIVLASGWFAPAASAATGTCGPATGQGVNGPADYSTYCWIDFANYNAAQATGAGEPFTITLPGGSTLSFTLTVSGSALKAATIPTWTGAAFGQSAFTSVPGNPSLYQTAGGTTNVSLSNIVLTVGSGSVPYAIVAADAESTNNGESLSFTTNGNAWTLLAQMAYTGSPTYPTLGGVGTGTVTETGVAGNVGAYAFSTQGSPTTISSVLVGGGLQGIAFAVKFHAVDFAIASSHSGSFAAGGTGTYTLTASSNGPDAYSTPNTITVTDTLPTGLSYVSATGTGWSCSAVGQVVTCTTSANLASGSSLPAITLNVSVANTVASSVTNTATVAGNPSYDFNSANNTATDVTTIVEPDLTTSTKGVLNPGGGDYIVGSTVQYTVTLTESAGAVAAGVSVTDNLPSNVSGFTVTSFPTGSTNSSTGTGTGTNNTGFLNVTGITVPANGTVTIVFTVQVAAGTANCTNINNTATITNPNGATTSITPSAPTITVAESSCAASGSKILYVYDNTTVGFHAALSRIPQPANTGTAITVAANGLQDFTLTPVLAKSLKFANTPDVGNVTMTVRLIETATGGSAGTNRPTTVELRTGAGVSIATSASVNVTNGPTVFTYTITIPKDTVVAAGNTLVLRLRDNHATRTISFSQKTAALGDSTASFNTPTVINVDSVTSYNAVYPAVTQTTVYTPNGNSVFVCAVISDPFGSADVSSATITLTDPNGVTQVSAAAMTAKGATDCSGAANSADEAFEYTYAISGAAVGFWTATVTGNEGTEGTVTHTANGSFEVDVPSLLIMKTASVTTDPVELAVRSKAIPGATAQYTILVQNNGRGPVDTSTFVISDPVPTNTGLSLTAKPPFTFTDGATSSGLSVTSGSDANIVYSNNNGVSYVYTPACTRPCVDTTITNFKITLTGKMNGKTGASAPSFTITYNVVIQ